MVSSSPFSSGRGIKSIFSKDTNRSRANSTTALPQHSEPTPPLPASQSQPLRRGLSMSSSSHRLSMMPDFRNRPLPSPPTAAAIQRSSSSDYNLLSKTRNKPAAKKQPLYKRFSRAITATTTTAAADDEEEDDESLAATYTAYLTLDGSQTKLNQSESSSLHQEDPTRLDNDNNTRMKRSQSLLMMNEHDGVLPKSAVRRNQVARLVNELDQLKHGKSQEWIDLEQRYNHMERMLAAKEAEYNKISANFHKHVMTIRATDDDFSTIQTKLTMLQSKIASLPLALKKYAVDHADATAFFEKRWPSLVPAIDHLRHQKKTLDYNIICMLVEKLVTETLVDRIYNVPVHVGLPANQAYEEIKRLMDPYDPVWSVRLRQQLCKLTVHSIHANDAMAQTIGSAKAAVTDALVELLATHLYTTPEGRPSLASKIARLVDAAADVSLAMHSQDVMVQPRSFKEGGQENLLNPDLATVQQGSAENATRIQIVICPPFTARDHQDDDNTNELLLLKGKVICF